MLIIPCCLSLAAQLSGSMNMLIMLRQRKLRSQRKRKEILSGAAASPQQLMQISITH